MEQWIECVPNFSEGRNTDTINAIVAAIVSVPQVYVLHVDMGTAANRTVITFAGIAEQVVEAAFRAMDKAAELIDMRNQYGVHPRMGAIDVCPLIPLRGINLSEVAELAVLLAKRAGNELNIPIYLYEASAPLAKRSNLAHIRNGEYEGLAKKMATDGWHPDYGPLEFQPKVGATVLGARNFLIAYNINLKTNDESIAKRIAETIRQSGSKGRPGLLPAVKAIGWYLSDFNRVQVSCNLIDFKQTSVSELFKTTQLTAKKTGTTVTGSELIGLIPLQAILPNTKLPINSTELLERLNTVADTLGLGELNPFRPEKRIIELALYNQHRINLSLDKTF